MPLTTEELNKKAAYFRAHPTPAERTALKSLRKSPLFYNHQKVIGFYVVDFYVPSKLLAIEIDGHNSTSRADYDRLRDVFLNQCNITVLRLHCTKCQIALSLVNEHPDIENWQGKSKEALRTANTRKQVNEDHKTADNMGVNRDTVFARKEDLKAY